jgi:hypothetical protein
MSNPSESHWIAAKRVLRYLKGTSDLSLYFGKETSKLYGYCDADWAGNQEQRKSTTGYVFMLNGGSVSWLSKLQSTVALSSAEAEYIALCLASQEVTYLNGLLSEIDPQDGPIVIKDDNQACIAMAKNPVLQNRTKHIDIKYHFVRECIQKNLIELEYCPTEEMVADVFTKPVSKSMFHKARIKLLGSEDTTSEDLLSR